MNPIFGMRLYKLLPGEKDYSEPGCIKVNEHQGKVYVRADMWDDFMEELKKERNDIQTPPSSPSRI